MNMDARHVDAFRAITAFVKDLWEVFPRGGDKPTPLALYHRLLENINKKQSAQGMMAAIKGFEAFFQLYETYVIENQLDKIPRDVKIVYGTSEKAYLEIQKYIYKTQNDSETRQAIRQHLVSISAILVPDKKKLEELEKEDGDLNIDESTAEGHFISGIMKKAKTQMGDDDDPSQAMSALFSTVVPQMIMGLQSGVQSGNMDMYKLMGTMQQAMSSMMPPQEKEAPNIREIKEE